MGHIGSTKYIQTFGCVVCKQLIKALAAETSCNGPLLFPATFQLKSSATLLLVALSILFPFSIYSGGSLLKIIEIIEKY